MFIYGDESGNTGRNIFDEQDVYRQGAILSTLDIDPIVSPIIRGHIEEQQVDRIHANELPPPVVARIGQQLISALNENADWNFFVGTIHKPYMTTTKFVDTIFDSGENTGSRWQWYNWEFLRHSLCVHIDEAFTPQNRERFWNAYLADDVEGVRESIRKILWYSGRKTKDRRVRQVIKEACDFALRYTEEITLMGNKSKKSYKGHTPNMVAFTMLINEAHNFAEKHNSPPIAFIHDQQSEFGKSMRDTHKLFGGVRLKSTDMMAEAERIEYDLGKFSTPSSKDMPSLQATDVLLWLHQREETFELKAVQEALGEKVVTNYMSRTCSDLIVQSWIHKINRTPLPDHELQKFQHKADEMEDGYYQRVEKYKRDYI